MCFLLYSVWGMGLRATQELVGSTQACGSAVVEGDESPMRPWQRQEASQQSLLFQKSFSFAEKLKRQCGVLMRPLDRAV